MKNAIIFVAIGLFLPSVFLRSQDNNLVKETLILTDNENDIMKEFKPESIIVFLEIGKKENKRRLFFNLEASSGEKTGQKYFDGIYLDYYFNIKKTNLDHREINGFLRIQDGDQSITEGKIQLFLLKNKMTRGFNFESKSNITRVFFIYKK